MSHSHRDQTYVFFEPVEAYAAASRRVMRITGTEVDLELRAESDAARGALRDIHEGATLLPVDLETVVPGLPDMQWKFESQHSTFQFRLSTTTSGVAVSLSMPYGTAESPFFAQAQLRGLAARLAVSMTHPRQD